MADMLTIHVDRQPDIRFQDGGLRHALGVKSFGVMRANREHPQEADGFGWTYNHAAMLAWYCGKYYLEYLSNPVSEHETPGQTLLCDSEDGIHWSFPRVAFPAIEVSLGCYRGPRSENMPQSILTVPHQRMGFYCAPNGVMLLLSFYGIVHDRHLCAPCDGWGVGRAVRRIYPDGRLGEICFLMYNEVAGYNCETAPQFEFYENSGDEELISACRELLNDRPGVNQMYEEQRNDKTLFPEPLRQAASFYTVKGDEMITVFKHGVSMDSKDGGRTWSKIVPNPTLRTSTGKVWGQRTPDGRFALMYNPTPDGQHRWPIAIVGGTDGRVFGGMAAATGYMSPQRYGGIDKNLGPQYMRGICERNPQAPDGRIHLAYSNNKEDIWISHIEADWDAPAEGTIDERFAGNELPRRWNVYSPVWAPVRMTDGGMRLADFDPYDRALAERCVKPSAKGSAAFTLRVGPVCAKGEVCVALHDEASGAPAEIYFTAEGVIRVRAAGRAEPWTEYAGVTELRVDFDCLRGRFTLSAGGKTKEFAMNTACDRIERVSVSTKPLSALPYNTVYDNGKYGTKEKVLPGAGEKTELTQTDIITFRFVSED